MLKNVRNYDAKVIKGRSKRGRWIQRELEWRDKDYPLQSSHMARK
jgi:hypothetical protein